jgi:hypothetical protein
MIFLINIFVFTSSILFRKDTLRDSKNLLFVELSYTYLQLINMDLD